MNKVWSAAGVALALAVSTAAFGLMEYSTRGSWPGTWPQELEPLRKQSYSSIGPIVTERHYIPFESREQFEAIWPQVLKTRPQNQRKAIRLVSEPLQASSHFNKPAMAAGVLLVQNPGPHLGDTGVPITLVVDGKIVDLNRIAFPRDTEIIDDRFPAVTFEISEEVQMSAEDKAE